MKGYSLLIPAIVVLACMKPVARFSINTMDADAPASVVFTNQSSGADSYLWDLVTEPSLPIQCLYMNTIIPDNMSSASQRKKQTKAIP